jgi:glucosamine--fructose-6-phosphate aminotransferase (isomerizing)
VHDAHTPTPYAHWMLREIHEQPYALAATLQQYLQGHTFKSAKTAAISDWLACIQAPLVIAASGSSRHAAQIAELMIEDLSGLAVDVEYASEYIYRSDNAWPNSAVMVVSQSGETADTLAALRKANLAGHQTLAITNVAGSAMDREATMAFPTFGGRERAIPATKSFTAQLLNLYLVALMSGAARGKLDSAALASRLDELAQFPGKIEAQLPGWDKAVQSIAPRYRDATSFLFLGRGLHYPIAREGALKLKESAYLSAEGYPSGELKHGPNALVAEGALLVMLATFDPADPNSVERYDKVVQLMRDMRAQGANILAIANTGDTTVSNLANHTVFIEPASEPLLAIAEVIPLQLFAYHMAMQHGVDVDHPRNLTKAVLTE